MHRDECPANRKRKGLYSWLNPLRGVCTVALPRLIVATTLVLAGCAAPHRSPERPPVPQVSENTWRQVDADIVAASRAAAAPSGNYGSGFMESWRNRVRQRTEEDFIPWYTSYWTQQWLAIKLGWYKLSDGEARNSATQRLAAYLQEQYNERVLAPVATEVAPDKIRRRATALYVRLLGEQLQGIPRRRGVPQDQFEWRLRTIPAISLAPPKPYHASLHEIIDTDPLAGLPAYEALIAQTDATAGAVVAASADAKISPMAEQIAEKLVARLAVSGSASAAAAAVGGVPGMVISLGAAGFGAIAHETARPALEAQLRETLNAALDERWHSLMEDPATGVMAGVHHISAQIEGSLSKTHMPSAEAGRASPEAPFSDEEAIPDDAQDDAAGDDDGPLEDWPGREPQ